MSAWSIGFRANREKMEILPEGGRKFNEWELYEFSAVPVPANAEAVTLLRSQGIDEETIAKAFVAEEELRVEAKEIAVTEDRTNLTMLLSINGKEQSITAALNDDMLKALQDNPDTQDDLAKALTALRDAFKTKEDSMTLSLQTMKSILANPTREGVTE
jgi:hypothetical protein